MNHRERNIILLSVAFVLFLGGAMTMLIIGVSFKNDYDELDIHEGIFQANGTYLTLNRLK